MKGIVMKTGRRRYYFVLCSLLFALFSCDYGQIGGADKTDYHFPGEAVFEERMDFLQGEWYARYAGIGRLDGYRIRKWSDFVTNDADKAKALEHFPDLASTLGNPRTYLEEENQYWPYREDNDYIVLYDDTAYGQGEDGVGGNEDWGFCYMGVVRAVTVFNGDVNRGAIIIEYLADADPRWLYSSQTYSGHSQGLEKGEKPFFGIYYRVLGRDVVQMANAVDLAALYAGKPYYTEKGTLEEAIEANGAENESEFISWGIVIPQERER